MIRPPFLAPGGTVALLAPAGPVSGAEVRQAALRVAALGFRPRLLGPTASRRGYLAGEDADRAAAFLTAWTDPAIDALLALRGGYGSGRILSHLPRRLAGPPKWVIGGSDITALHAYLGAQGIASLHGPMPATRLWTAAAAHGLWRLLSGKGADPVPLPTGSRPRRLRGGRARGPLWGGNLSLVAALAGTPLAPQVAGLVLLLEEVGEPLYRLDRLLWQLRESGLLARAAAVLVGEITPPLKEREMAVYREILADYLLPLAVPVLWEMPFGHGLRNMPLPLGLPARVDADTCTLTIGIGNCGFS